MKDINLMPEEVKPISIPKKEASTEIKISKKVIIILASVLIFMIVSILSPKIYVKSLEAYSSSIQADMASNKYIEVKSVNEQIASIQATLDLKNDVINEISNSEVKVLDVINYVQEAAPKGLYITGMEYGDNKLSIAGTVKDTTTIAEYDANLLKLNAFRGYSSNFTLNYEKANAMSMFKVEFTKSKQGE